MTVAVSQAELVTYVTQVLSQVCQKDDVKHLRNMLRELFGKQLQDLIADKTAGREQYTIESPQLKDAIRSKLPVACAKSGSLQCMKVLQQRLPGVLDLDQKDSDGNPCLHLAITGHHIPMALFLIDSGVDVNAVDRQGRSALHWAIVCQIPELLSRLAIKKADLNIQDSAGAAAIHYAAQMCGNREVDMYVSLDCLQHLLCLRPNASVKDQKGRTPLHWAATAGSPDACKLLVTAGAPVDVPDETGCTALHAAVRKGSPPAVAALVRDCSAQTELRDGDGRTPAALALTCGTTDCLIRLVKLGASEILDDKRKSVAHVAAASGDLELVRKLQAAGLQFWGRTLRGELPVHFAVIAKHNEVACHLLRDEVHGNPRGSVMKTCLHLAVRTTNTELIDRLLGMGADINSVLQYQGRYMSPLDVATEKSLEDCLAYVLQCNGQSALVVIERAARIVQRTMRRVAAIRKRKELLAEAAARQALQQRSARILQRSLRRLVAVRRLAALRRERELARRREREERSAKLLQRTFRRLVAIRRLAALRRERELARRREQEERSALVLQSVLRRVVAMRQLQRLANARRAEQERRALLERSARLVQNTMRRLTAVRHLQRLRQEKRREQAAFVVQRAMRRLAAVRHLQRLRQEKRRNEAAFVVQRAMRCIAAVRHLQRLRQEKRRNEAALVVQRAMRRLSALLRLPRARLWLDERRRRRTEEKSAAVLQRSFRRLAAMRRLRAIVAEREEERRRRRILLERSALIVLRALRRLVAVRRARTVTDRLRAERRNAPVIVRALRRLVAIRRLQPERYQQWLEERRERAAAMLRRSIAAGVVVRTLRRLVAARKLRTLRAEQLRRQQEEEAEERRQRSARLLQRTMRKMVIARRMASTVPRAVAEEEQSTEVHDPEVVAGEQSENKLMKMEEEKEEEKEKEEKVQLVHLAQPLLQDDEAKEHFDPDGATARQEEQERPVQEKAEDAAARQQTQERPGQKEGKEAVAEELRQQSQSTEAERDERPERGDEPAPVQAELESHSMQLASLAPPPLVEPDALLQLPLQSAEEQTAPSSSEVEPPPPPRQQMETEASSALSPPAAEELAPILSPSAADGQPSAQSHQVTHRVESALPPPAEQLTSEPSLTAPLSTELLSSLSLPQRPPSRPAYEQHDATGKTETLANDDEALRENVASSDSGGQVNESSSASVAVPVAMGAAATAEAAVVEPAGSNCATQDAHESDGVGTVAVADNGDELHYYTDEYDDAESLDGEAALTASLGTGTDFAEAAEAVRQHNAIAALDSHYEGADEAAAGAAYSRSATPASQSYSLDCYSDFEELGASGQTAAIAKVAQPAAAIEGTRKVKRDGRRSHGGAKVERAAPQASRAAPRRREANVAAGGAVALGAAAAGSKSRGRAAAKASKDSRRQQVTAPPAPPPPPQRLHQPHAPRTPHSGQHRRRQRKREEVLPADSGVESAASLSRRSQEAVCNDTDLGVREEAPATDEHGAAVSATDSWVARRSRPVDGAGGGGTFFSPRPPASGGNSSGGGGSGGSSSSSEEEHTRRRRRRRRRARKVLPAAAAHKDLFPLPDAFRYYASVAAAGSAYHRWSALDFLSRPVSDSLRFKVQLSVRQHEVYKAIAKGYNTTHTKTTASIPSFPIISPVKYLTAADLR